MRLRSFTVAGVCLLALALAAAATDSFHQAVPMESKGPWAHGNLVASGLLDTKSRTIEGRARMLADLGLKQVALGSSQDGLTLDAQIETLGRHGVKILGWFVDDTDEPTVELDWKQHKTDSGATDSLTLGELLEKFKRHSLKPQLWLERNMRVPKRNKPFMEMSDKEKDDLFRSGLGYDLTSTPEERALRIRQEAGHLKPLAQLAATYGVTVALYKHGGWMGIEDNCIAVIERLKALGINNVGMVYRFIHAHDEVDDTADFASVWRKIQPYVLVVDITGLHAGRTRIFPILYPSQGALELKMMKVIQDSGWTGTIGVSAEKGGDAEVNLRKNLLGLDWIAAELRQPGSGGPPPFATAP